MLNSYRSLCTQFYDIEMPLAQDDAFALYAAYAKEADGPILEPMCGSGRFLIPLMEQSFDIDGVDASSQMLQACRERGRSRGLSPELYEQSLDQLTLPRQYVLVIIPERSFGLIGDLAQARQSLRCMREALLPGGKLVFDVSRATSQASGSWPWQGRWVKRPDGAMIIMSATGRYDAAQKVTSNIARYELVKDGHLLETEIEEFSLRFYDPAQLCHELAAAGFAEIKTLKAYEAAEPADTDAVVVFEARRP